MLPWFDEPTGLLRECVAGAAVFADRLVAADGAYELVPDKRAQSPPSQKRAIREAAQKAGMKVEFLRPQVWKGQVAKRDAILQTAKQGSQWVMTLDADWLITGEPDPIRAELDALYAAGYEQVNVEFATPNNPDVPLAETAANIWHEQQADTFQQLPFIYRSLPKMHYIANHWSIVGWTEDERPIGLFGGAAGYPTYQGGGVYGPAKTAVLQEEHLFEHRCLFRERKQIERNRDYIIERDNEVAKVGYET